MLKILPNLRDKVTVCLICCEFCNHYSSVFDNLLLMQWYGHDFE